MTPIEENFKTKGGRVYLFFPIFFLKIFHQSADKGDGIEIASTFTTIMRGEIMKYLSPTIKGLLEQHADGITLEDASFMVAEAEGNIGHIYQTIFDLRRLCDTSNHEASVDTCVNHDFIDGLLAALCED